MKLMYKIIIFLIAFQFMVLIINSMGIFPGDTQFYSDIEMQDIQGKTYFDVFATLFAPVGNSYFSSMSMSIIVGLFVTGTFLVGILTKSYILVPIIVIGYSFYNMMTKSYDFFIKIFEQPGINSPQLIYLGVCIGTLLVFVAIITVVETASHGRSG